MQQGGDGTGGQAGVDLAQDVAGEFHRFVSQMSDFTGVESPSISQAQATSDGSPKQPSSQRPDNAWSVSSASDGNSSDDDDDSALEPIQFDYDRLMQLLRAPDDKTGRQPAAASRERTGDGRKVRFEADLVDSEAAGADTATPAPVTAGKDENQALSEQATLDAIMLAMDRELRKSTAGQSFERVAVRTLDDATMSAPASDTSDQALDSDDEVPENAPVHDAAVTPGSQTVERGDSDDDSVSDDDDDGPLAPVEVDFNLVKNLMHSVGHQQGLSGPGANLLQERGIQLPADWFAGEAEVPASPAATSPTDAYDALTEVYRGLT